MPEEEPTPDHIMEIGFGFFASKTLLTAVELGVFDALAAGPKARADVEDVDGGWQWVRNVHDDQRTF